MIEKARWLSFAILIGGFFSQVDQSRSWADPPLKYALLVGVTRYQHAELNKPPLAFPEVDARSVGEFLAEHGYEVEYLLGSDATKKSIERKLEAFGSKGNQDGVAILGLWGHGVEFEGSSEAMFCPYDAAVRLLKDGEGRTVFLPNGVPSIEPDPDSLVSMVDCLAGLRISGAGNRVLLADCCRTSPHKARGRAFGQSVKAADLPSNTLAILACQPSQQAYEHDQWGHGAMTKALLDSLPELAKQDADYALNLVGPMTTKVNRMVREVTGGRQTQTIYQLSTGNPLLKLGARRENVALIPPGLRLTDSEKAARRRKAIAELANLGDENETAYIRGKLYGPQSLTFQLENWEEDHLKFFKELQSVNAATEPQLYESMAEKLLKGMHSSTSSDDYWNQSRRVALTKSDSFFTLSCFRENEIYHAIPTMIRPLLALTTEQQRLKFLRPRMDSLSDADLTVMASLCNQYGVAKRTRADFSHAPYAVVAPTLLGDFDAAMDIAKNLDGGKRTAALMLICDTLLDQGNRDQAKTVFSNANKSIGSTLLVGSFPLPRNDFLMTGSIPEFFTLTAYIAGRLDDEAVYKQLPNVPRRAFIVGLVRDL